MSKPFKMRGPTFFKTAVKSYSPAKQGTQLNPQEVEPTQDEQAAADAKAEAKRQWVQAGKAAGATSSTQWGRRSAAQSKSPNKQGPWGGVQPAKTTRDDMEEYEAWYNQMNKPGSEGSGAPMRSPNKQTKFDNLSNVDLTPKVGAGGKQGTHEMASPSMKKKSPNKQGRQLNPPKAEYGPGEEPEQWIQQPKGSPAPQRTRAEEKMVMKKGKGGKRGPKGEN